MIRSDIINLAKKLIMQGDIDPLWSNAEWSLFFDEAVDLVHEALVDSETGYFEVRDYMIEPDEEGKFQLPEDFYSMIYARDSLGKLEHLTIDEERNNGTTGYIILGDRLEIRNADSRLTPVYIDYYRLPKTMPLYEGGSDEGNSVSNNIEDFIPDPPLDTERGAKVLARILQYLAQNKDGTMTEAVSGHINRIVDRFTDRLYQRQRQ
ncbi:MAG: hypothetical protein J6Z11_03960 [Candidatus Riflebacteria bacterium]|nr:hypothetical protein [Candidatus Riflebacteria bacterium]